MRGLRSPFTTRAEAGPLVKEIYRLQWKKITEIRIMANLKLCVEKDWPCESSGHREICDWLLVGIFLYNIS